MIFVVLCPGTPEGSTGCGSCFKACFCGRVPWLYQYWPGGFMLFVVLCPGTPEGSTGSGSGFKASQKTGQRLKVSSDRLGEAGNRTCDPWFTRHSAYPLHHGGFFVLKRLRRPNTVTPP